MPIPTTRHELVEGIRTSFAKLSRELHDAGPRAGSLMCTEEWSVKQLLAVRAWWTEAVIDWVESGRRDEVPITPAHGYRWNETPRLNGDVVQATRRESYRSVRGRLQLGYERVLTTLDLLSDRELLRVGVFAWAGKHPVARWVSMNTATQYASARGLVRRALRSR